MMLQHMRPYPRISIISLACLTALSAAGCQEDAQPPSATQVSVVVSIAPQAWLVQRIAQQHAAVTTVLEPWNSPQVYQPTDAQVSGIMRASVYFRIGAPFESGRWFDAIRSSKKLRIVDTRRGITLREMARHIHHPEAATHEGERGQTHHSNHASEPPDHRGHAHTGMDPHIWLCPRLLKVQARTVAEALKELDPAHQADYTRNLRELEHELNELHTAISATLAPFRGRGFMVFHPAWGYFADEYSLSQIPIELGGKDPSDHELTRLQQRARSDGIKVIFVQPQIADRAARAIAAVTGCRVEGLDPLAPDVPANLMRVAEVLAASYRE